MTTAIGNGDGRSVEKLSASQQNTKRYSFQEFEGAGFSGILQKCPPSLPPSFLRKMDFKESGVGKVKVMLRISNPISLNSASFADDYSRFLTLDKRKKQVTLIDPAASNGIAPEDRRVGVAAPKMFNFDAIFSQDDSQTELCSGVLTDVIHAVINGNDGCLFSFGQVGLGKTYTMLGSPENSSTIGIIPCAISWLFRGISEQKQRTGARFSVRVSAVEIGGPTNQLKDLLAGYSNESEQSPGVYLQDDHLFTNQHPPHCELRVSSAEKAANYLDAALESRSFFKEEMRDSHFLFTLHIYQYSVAGKGGVAGGRSRLHLIDLGNTDRSKASGGISLSGVGNIILAILNGQKHLPYKEHKLTQLLKECLGPVSCHATIIAHVSPFSQNYSDTLTTIQLASRIHRMRRRRLKFVSTSISNSSGGSSGEDIGRTGTSSEPDPSSSDLSADTVIYVGRAEEATDGEHPPVYIPSLNSGDNSCSMIKVLEDSIAEHKVTQTAKPSKSSDRSIRSSKIPQSHRMSIHSGSSRSSPSRKESSKFKTDTSKYFSNGCSDEQWIDGPRISKSKIAEAFQLMKEKYRVQKCETWIDGPMKEEISSNYGYMDSHKKHMIKKWVEHQTIQMQKTKHVTPKTEGLSQNEPHYSKFSDGLQATEKLKKQKFMERPSKVKGVLTDEENEDEEEPELPPALPLIQPLSSREVSIESLDQILRGRMLSSGDYDYHENTSVEENIDNDVLEIIEVEEPLEPVPTQDQCLQVTEEDILLCMGQSENPLPEVDQQSSLQTSMRLLSEENLSAISSFTDSMLVFNDLEKILPRYLDLNGFYNDYEDIDNPAGKNIVREDSCINKLSHSTSLHKIFCKRLGNTDITNSDSSKSTNALKSFTSMTLTDLLLDRRKQRKDDRSIYSEPIYLQERFCENCKAHILRTDATPSEYNNTNYFDNQSFNSTCQTDLGGRFQRFKHRAKELSELRHPDGASNPNLDEGTGKMLGSLVSEYISTQPLSPRSFSSLGTRTNLNFETGIAAIKLKHKPKKIHKAEEYDSGHDSISRTPKHSPAAILRKAESGYDSIIRDGEISHNDSGLSDISIPHSRRSKCKHNHNKSFCSWFLNPFTCKYVDEPKETPL